jgi:hypothetical protein
MKHNNYRGIAFTDKLRIDKALEVAKVQEIIGGARNVQLYLVNRAIKNMISCSECSALFG